MSQFKEKKFYIYKFLNDCIPIYALYAILFKEKGMTLSQIALLLSFWSLVALIGEIPSGILADRWNRRYMLLISTILKAVCYIIWSFGSIFIMFALGFLFWGIAGAFRSGTEESLIYDNLKSEDREKEFIKIYGKGKFYASIGNLVGIISSGILSSFISISMISTISALICLIDFIFAYQLNEKNYYSERLKQEATNYFGTFFEAIKLCFKNSKIILSMIFLVLIVSVVGYLDEYDALIIDNFDLKNTYIWISVIFAVRFLFIAIGNILAPVIEKKKKSKNIAFILGFASSIFLLLFSMIWNKYGILILGIYCMIMTVVDVIQINIMQKEIKEEGRATIMSVYGVCQNIAMIIFSLIYALMFSIWSLKTVYIIISIYCIVGTIMIYILSNVARKQKFSHQISNVNIFGKCP